MRSRRWREPAGCARRCWGNLGIPVIDHKSAFSRETPAPDRCLTAARKAGRRPHRYFRGLLGIDYALRPARSLTALRLARIASQPY
jgi:hypothetical protein